jgi:hypothetical protein
VRSALADVIGAAVMVARKLWTVEDIVNLVDAAAPVASPRGPYKKRVA